MNDVAYEQGERYRRLDEIIAEYLRRTKEGELNADELLIREHPEFSAELREFFENEAKFRKLLQPIIGNNIGETAEFSSSKLVVSSSKSKPPSLSSTRTTPRRPVLNGIRYELNHFYDRGGMGEIWLAQDQRIGREIAIRFYVPSGLSYKNGFNLRRKLVVN